MVEYLEAGGSPPAKAIREAFGPQPLGRPRTGVGRERLLIFLSGLLKSAWAHRATVEQRIEQITIVVRTLGREPLSAEILHKVARARTGAAAARLVLAYSEGLNPGNFARALRHSRRSGK
jgi:hypothetical protein